MEASGKKSRFPRKGLIGIGIILLAVGMFMYLKSTRPEQPPVEVKQKTWPVTTLSVTPGKLGPMHTLYGTVESNALVTAAAPVAGVIDNVEVKEGDPMTAGQLLAALSDADIELPYQVAQADVADTAAQLALQDLAYQSNVKRLQQEEDVLVIKRKDVQRNEDLIKRDLISKSTLDNSREALVRQEFAVVSAQLAVQENKARVDQLKARLEKAQANLNQAEINRERGVVIAPYDGRIADVPVSSGDRVGVNNPLVSYYALDSLELRAQIPLNLMDAVYQSMKNDEPVIATYLFDGQLQTLRLKRLAGQATTSGVDGFFAIPENLRLLRPGNLLKVQLQGQAVEQAFALPYSAIYGSNRIYLVEDGKLRAITVNLLGDTLVDGQSWALVQADLPGGALVATTHLPNAITGLQVRPLDNLDE